MALPDVISTAPVRIAGAALAALALASCGGTSSPPAINVPNGTATTTTAAAVTPLPGTGRPAVTIGDKNFTEQFVLGELYHQALTAEGFNVVLNRNIGPTSVTYEALKQGTLGMYPEYLSTWDSTVAGIKRSYRTLAGAYRAGQKFAISHGLELLTPTPFSDTDAIGVTVAYAQANGLRTVGDLRRVGTTLTLGGPPQFKDDPQGMPAMIRDYGVLPAAFLPLDVGGQYAALNQGTVQAADVGTTDGELATGDYVLLGDPRNTFGWGNVVAVVSQKVLEQQGPTFAATINDVNALLTTDVMRQLNYAVDVAHEDPATVARQFLQTHGLIPLGQP